MKRDLVGAGRRLLCQALGQHCQIARQVRDPAINPVSKQVQPSGQFVGQLADPKPDIRADHPQPCSPCGRPVEQQAGAHLIGRGGQDTIDDLDGPCGHILRAAP